ncbi:MAG: CinA family protein [Aquabacterium sp.]|uniref:CinA family protein n=1 Tax=Aquabacterium sp. TaxID=1872578 RepID=UPI0025C3DFF1|nr:CinA family protein [Aquabacterium sp.]MBI5924505.1 CinA family protein [Aquabacterium sp.]
MDTQQTLNLVQTLAERLLARGWLMAAAESCTGGLIAAACTELAGSSAWFDRGFVTYSNQAKTELLGVDAALIATHGAVSEAVAKAMAEGAVQRAGVQVAVAVTGIAGPTGGSPDKPVGTVWLAWACKDQPTRSQCCLFEGDRAQIRQQTCEVALAELVQFVTAAAA